MEKEQLLRSFAPLRMTVNGLGMTDFRDRVAHTWVFMYAP
jgi:hypothetical protein